MGLCLIIALVDLIGIHEYLCCLLCYDKLFFMLLKLFLDDRVVVDNGFKYGGIHITYFALMNMSCFLVWFV